jgi:hypothetical protein
MGAYSVSSSSDKTEAYLTTKTNSKKDNTPKINSWYSLDGPTKQYLYLGAEKIHMQVRMDVDWKHMNRGKTYTSTFYLNWNEVEMTVAGS